MCTPDAERVAVVVLIAADRDVIRHGNDAVWIIQRETEPAGFIGVFPDGSVETDFNRLFWTRNFVAVKQPAIRKLDLFAFYDFLSEEAKLIADAAADSRKRQRRQ